MCSQLDVYFGNNPIVGFLVLVANIKENRILIPVSFCLILFKHDFVSVGQNDL